MTNDRRLQEIYAAVVGAPGKDGYDARLRRLEATVYGDSKRPGLEQQMAAAQEVVAQIKLARNALWSAAAAIGSITVTVSGGLLLAWLLR